MSEVHYTTHPGFRADPKVTPKSDTPNNTFWVISRPILLHSTQTASNRKTCLSTPKTFSDWHGKKARPWQLQACEGVLHRHLASLQPSFSFGQLI